MMINIFLWLLFGILAGVIVSRLSDRFLPDNVMMNSVAGVLGAMLAGFIFLIFDVTPLNVINIWGIISALIGAVAGISLVQMLVRHSDLIAAMPLCNTVIPAEHGYVSRTWRFSHGEHNQQPDGRLAALESIGTAALARAYR